MASDWLKSLYEIPPLVMPPKVRSLSEGGCRSRSIAMRNDISEADDKQLELAEIRSGTFRNLE